MTLPHYDSMQDAPQHLKTRSGLRKLGYAGPKPLPVATVLAFNKVVFLYDAEALGVLVSRVRVRCVSVSRGAD